MNVRSLLKEYSFSINYKCLCDTWNNPTRHNYEVITGLKIYFRNRRIWVGVRFVGSMRKYDRNLSVGSILILKRLKFQI